MAKKPSGGKSRQKDYLHSPRHKLYQVVDSLAETNHGIYTPWLHRALVLLRHEDSQDSPPTATTPTPAAQTEKQGKEGKRRKEGRDSKGKPSTHHTRSWQRALEVASRTRTPLEALSFLGKHRDVPSYYSMLSSACYVSLSMGKWGKFSTYASLPVNTAVREYMALFVAIRNAGNGIDDRYDELRHCIGCSGRILHSNFSTATQGMQLEGSNLGLSHQRSSILPPESPLSDRCLLCENVVRHAAVPSVDDNSNTSDEQCGCDVLGVQHTQSSTPTREAMCNPNMDFDPSNHETGNHLHAHKGGVCDTYSYLRHEDSRIISGDVYNNNCNPGLVGSSKDDDTSTTNNHDYHPPSDNGHVKLSHDLGPSGVHGDHRPSFYHDSSVDCYCYSGAGGLDDVGVPGLLSDPCTMCRCLAHIFRHYRVTHDKA